MSGDGFSDEWPEPWSQTRARPPALSPKLDTRTLPDPRFSPPCTSTQLTRPAGRRRPRPGHQSAHHTDSHARTPNPFSRLAFAAARLLWITHSTLMARNLDSYTDEHRPRRRIRHGPYYDKRDDDFERDPAVLGLDELRRARSEYYSRPEDKRMRARGVRHMAQEVHMRERERDIVERSRERRADSRRREWRRERDVVRRKKKKEPEEDEDSEVYVYGRPREVRERREPRLVRDTSPSREQRRARRPVEAVRVSRVRTVKRNGDTVNGVAGSSRRVAEEEPDLRSRGARSRQESRPRSEPRAAPRSISIRQVEAPKLNRYISLPGARSENRPLTSSRSISAREAPRVYMTRPSLKRGNTITRVAKIPITAPPSVRPSRAQSVVRRTGTPGNLSATPGRRSSGILATLFKPSPSRSAPTIVQKAELK